MLVHVHNTRSILLCARIIIELGKRGERKNKNNEPLIFKQ